jgi:drug/metabolite transporter (DMT)-like permease
MERNAHPRAWKVLLAFAIIYFVWGSTYLAIRVGVREIPPFVMAAIRFLIAGSVLYTWMRIKGAPSPTARQWAGASILAVLIFVLDYGLVFWAERRVASGVAAVMMATIPVFMTLSEIVIMKTQQLTIRLAIALLVGIAGVGVLVSHSANFSDTPIDTLGACALLVAAMSWSVGSALTRKLPLPPEKGMSSGAQMFAGGILLTFTAALSGEFRGFHLQSVSGEAWFALVYLIVAGSIIAFTAYVWLIHYESPTKVGTYAYVNPVVAVVLGYFLAGETIGARTILGTLLVLVSVIVITTAPKRSNAQSAVAPELSN